jgi:polyisoprenoid-binding protein YceI
MKGRVLTLGAFAALMLMACGPSEAEMQAEKEKAQADSLAALAAMEQSWMVDPEATTVHWRGTMLGVKEHFGTIKLLKGQLMTRGGQVIGGDIVIDMTSIDPQDSAYDEKQTRENLMGHLASADFFDVQAHPDARLTITAVDGTSGTGDLTVRGQTHPEVLQDLDASEENNILKAHGKLVFDRQKYGATFSTGLKDYVISDEIEITVDLTANKMQ